MGTIADQIMKYLAHEGHGIINNDLFLGFMPVFPDNCITIYDETTSSNNESNCLEVDLFGIEILVRNTNYNTCYLKLRNIHKDIAGFGGQKLLSLGDQISYITVEVAPYHIGKDEKGRNKWISRYAVRAMSKFDDWRL